MNQHSPLTSTSFADAVLDMVHLPVLLVDAQRQVRWMNEAARSVASWDGGGPEGHFFGRVLGLDRENSDRVLPNDALSSETEWCDVTVPVQLGAARALRVRRKTYRERSGECCALLTVEGAAWWEEPEVDWLTGPRFLMFEADTEGRLVRGAASLGRLLGTAPEDLVGKPIAELLMGDARIRLDESWRRVIEGKHERIAECGLIGADAALHSFSLSLFPIRGIRGGVAGVRIAAVDLETQKDLAYALEAAEERFSVVFRESSDPILILSMRGEILSANTAFEELTGIASEELFRGGKSWTDFVVQEDMNELATLISSMSSGRPQKGCEFRLRLREGEPQWFEQRLSDLHDEKGRPKGFLAVARNIHHRKLVEQALRKEARAMEARHTRAQGLIERLKKFFALTSELPGGLVGFLEGLCEILMDMYEPTLCYIHIHDSDRIVYRCRGGVDLPLEGEKPVGLPTVLSRRTAEAGVPVLTAQVDDDAEARTDPVLAALGIQTFLGSALQDSHGLIRGTISVLDRQSRVVDSLDVELITVAALQVAARLRTEEEEAARQELEAHLRQSQKMEALGMLAGGVAHDFNNILSGILGFSSYLMTQVEEGSPIHRDLGLIETSAERASELTRRLLAFARRKHFPKEAVSLNRLIGETAAILQRTLDKNIRLVTELDDDDPQVLGDAGQLSQVLMNLCLNGSEAMATEGGKLIVQTRMHKLSKREQSTLGVKLDPQQKYVRLSVIDTGAGITEEVRAHMFDPFYTTKAAKGGTGLGLSIVYGIVTNHGGDVTVISQVEQGTTVRVYLPLHEGDVVSAREAPPRDVRGEETILVVDDELIVRQMVVEVLKDKGYQVLTASSGAEALEIIDAPGAAIDLVFLDMVMPGASGEDVFVEIRKRTTNLPVLLTSGYAQEEVTERLIRQGAAGMVYKPYKADLLASRVRQVLDREQ